jgi:hypothetical protein
LIITFKCGGKSLPLMIRSCYYTNKTNQTINKDVQSGD